MEMTFLAPRSTSISTSRCPTKPVPPVTTQTFGTGGRGLLDAAFCNGDDWGARSGAMAVAQVARRSGRAVLAAVLRRLGRGCFRTALHCLQRRVGCRQLQKHKLTRPIIERQLAYVRY